MLPRFGALLLLLAIFSSVSAYPTISDHGHGHDRGLANGQACEQSVSVVLRCETLFERGVQYV